LDAATRGELAQRLVAAREAAMQCPTVADADADAEAAGRYMDITTWMVHARVGEPGGRVLPREPQPPLRGRQLRHRRALGRCQGS